MFVKNVVDACYDNVVGGITVHKGQQVTQPYTGNIKDVPFYYLNERVKSLEVFLGNLFIHIEKN